MPRDGAKLSEVVFHKSVSVVIQANTDRKTRGCCPGLSANHCRGHPSARRACRALVGETAHRQFPIFHRSAGACHRDVERFMKHPQSNLSSLGSPVGGLPDGGLDLQVNDNVRYAGASISVDMILSDIARSLGFAVEKILVVPGKKGNNSQQMGMYGRVPLRKCVHLAEATWIYHSNPRLAKYSNPSVETLSNSRFMNEFSRKFLRSNDDIYRLKLSE